MRKSKVKSREHNCCIGREPDSWNNKKYTAMGSREQSSRRRRESGVGGRRVHVTTGKGQSAGWEGRGKVVDMIAFDKVD